MLSAHHVLNVLLASSFLVFKLTPVVCEFVFSGPEPCELSDVSIGQGRGGARIVVTAGSSR